MIKFKDLPTVSIDGSFGEGGGQILRTALSLSCVSGKPVEIENIRKLRPRPGLQPQHLMSVLAAARICGASVEGGQLSSTSLRFVPGQVRPGEYHFDVSSIKSSAGSTSLVFQTILLPLLLAGGGSNVIIRGGTHVPWSPTFHYLKQVFLPLLFRMNARVELFLEQWGWYPKGGGTITAQIEPCKGLRGINLRERGTLRKLRGISAISNLPDHIADRQKNRALQSLTQRDIRADIETVRAPSIGKGTLVFLAPEFEAGSAGFSSLGAIGKRAEAVADEACAAFFDHLDNHGALDPHLADQVLPYCALSDSPSEFSTSRVTRHLLTNAWVVRQFVDCDILIPEEERSAGLIRVMT